jgi:type I restriction enzyme M protein
MRRRGRRCWEFVDDKLFKTFKDLDPAEHEGLAQERALLLKSVFSDAYNYMKSGTLLRQVVDKINDAIDLNQRQTRDVFGDIYEKILKDLQSAGNAGEFYTPRAVTQFAVDMTNPQLGETVLDPACGTGGFLTCAYEHLKAQAQTPADLATAKASIQGVEKKQLPHLLCVTNMMVHGIEVPTNIRHDNTLRRPLRDYGPRDWVDVVVTNPPFGGMEEDGIEGGLSVGVSHAGDGGSIFGAGDDVAEAGGPGGDCAAGWHLVWGGHQDAGEGKAAAGLQLAHHCSLAQWGL